MWEIPPGGPGLIAGAATGKMEGIRNIRPEARR